MAKKHEKKSLYKALKATRLMADGGFCHLAESALAEAKKLQRRIGRVDAKTKAKVKSSIRRAAAHYADQCD